MAKLELKHIAPYLPYRLKYYPSKTSDLFHDAYADNSGFSSWDYVSALEAKDEYALKLKNSYLIQCSPFVSIEDDELFLGQFESSLGFDVDDVYASEVMPLLRPMSDLNPDELRQIISHLFRESIMIRPKMDSIKYEKGYITFYDLDTSRTYVAVKPGHEDLPVLNMSNTFDDYSIFFKLHIDMLDLIGKGLAVDINTI